MTYRTVALADVAEVSGGVGRTPEVVADDRRLPPVGGGPDTLRRPLCPRLTTPLHRPPATTRSISSRILFIVCFRNTCQDAFNFTLPCFYIC